MREPTRNTCGGQASGPEPPRTAQNRPGTVHFRRQMKKMRIAAGLTRIRLAVRLNRPQSFVAKHVGGERRVDVVEFMEVAEAIGFDPAQFIGRLVVSGDAPGDRRTRFPYIDPPKNRTDPPRQRRIGRPSNASGCRWNGTPRNGSAPTADGNVEGGRRTRRRAPPPA